MNHRCCSHLSAQFHRHLTLKTFMSSYSPTIASPIPVQVCSNAVGSSDFHSAIITLPSAILSQLTLDVIGRPSQLHQVLLPMLHDQTSHLRVHIPAFSRANGSESKSFVFHLALREHPQAHIRKLFPYRLSLDTTQGLQQPLTDLHRAEFNSMSETDKQAYTMLYTQAEWNATFNASRNISKAARKVGKRCFGAMNTISDAESQLQAPRSAVFTTEYDNKVIWNGHINSSTSTMASDVLVVHSTPTLKRPKLVQDPIVGQTCDSSYVNTQAMPHPKEMLRRYVESLQESNTPSESTAMVRMLHDVISFFAAHQTIPIPMMRATQSAKQPFYDMIQHHACYNRPGLAVNIEAVIQQMATMHPNELLNNFPGMSHVPVEASARVRLPALIKTSFNHPQYGATTVVAILWHMDTPQPEHLKEGLRGPGFERFFVHMDNAEADLDYPSLSDTAPGYKRVAEFNLDNDSEDSNNESCDGPQVEYDARGRRLRALCLHEIIAVYPVGTPLLHSAVGRYFSSFNSSLSHVNNVQAGWQGWHLLHDSLATMSRIMSTVGFLNHPAFTSTRVQEQLSTYYNDDVMQEQAQAHFEDEHDAAVHASGGNTADTPFDPSKHKQQITERARMMRHQGEDRLDPTTWCLRDALASMCASA